MKNTTLILLFVLLVLGGLTAWYYYSKPNHPQSSSLTANMEFAVEADLVHKIFLADREGNKTTLTREKDGWLYQGKYKPRQTAISYLLDAIENLEVKYRPAKAAYPTITKDLATFGVEVELYDKDGELLRNYYVGGRDEEGEGTYMIKAESEEIFAMHLKNFVGGLRTRYAMTGDDWRDRSVFDDKAEDIQKISVEYPKQRNKSFVLTRDGSSFKVEPLFKTTPIIKSRVIPGRPELYLKNFKAKIAESFQNEYSLKEVVQKAAPFAIITMTKTDGSEKSVKFTPFQKVDKFGNLIKQDPSQQVYRYHAICSWGDMLLVQHRVLQEIFWSYEGFFQ